MLGRYVAMLAAVIAVLLLPLELSCRQGLVLEEAEVESLVHAYADRVLEEGSIDSAGYEDLVNRLDQFGGSYRLELKLGRRIHWLGEDGQMRESLEYEYSDDLLNELAARQELTLQRGDLFSVTAIETARSLRGIVADFFALRRSELKRYTDGGRV